MKVLIACEFSGIVREAFKAKGHDAWSCDLLDTEIPGQHYKGHINNVFWFHLDGLPRRFDLMITHTPCKYTANSGVRWLHEQPWRWKELDKALRFWQTIKEAQIDKIAMENPIIHKYAREIMGKQSQIIQPWQFGHKEIKATCLWLKNLPPLIPTDIVGPPPKDPEEKKKWARVHREPPGPDRWKNRSRTFKGIAEAMAEQWG